MSGAYSGMETMLKSFLHWRSCPWSLGDVILKFDDAF